MQSLLLSSELAAVLQTEAERAGKTVTALAEEWLRQHYYALRRQQLAAGHPYHDCPNRRTQRPVGGWRSAQSTDARPAQAVGIGDINRCFDPHRRRPSLGSRD